MTRQDPQHPLLPDSHRIVRVDLRSEGEQQAAGALGVVAAAREGVNVVADVPDDLLHVGVVADAKADAAEDLGVL